MEFRDTLEYIIFDQTTEEDTRALTIFNDSINFKEHRYFVSWPWKKSGFDLPQNFSIAYGRLNSLIHKLNGNPELFSKYNDIILEQENLGIIEPVLDEATQYSLKHYIPHHPVVTESEGVTKVRIVYDASTRKNKIDLSLNDCLLRGPVILNDLCGF